MSQNCKTSYTTATTRDANNNTLYHGGPGQGYGGRGYTPPSVTSNGNYQCEMAVTIFGFYVLLSIRQSRVTLQMTAKVLFGSVTTINDLKRQDKAEREVRRTH